jgi:hypothetical protein
MQPITGIIILGIAILSLGVFLIVAGYDSSITSLGFGAYFVLVGGLYAVVLPILTPRIAPRYVEPQPPPPIQKNTPAVPNSGEPVPRRTRSTPGAAAPQPGVGRANGSSREKREAGNPTT